MDDRLAGSGLVAAGETEALRAVISLGEAVHERVAGGRLTLAGAALLTPLSANSLSVSAEAAP